MKLRLTLIVGAAVLAMPSLGATGQPAGPPSTPSVAQYQYQVDGVATGARTSTVTDGSLWRIRVLALRREAFELQQRDGGTLTPEHHAMLQAKLDRINAQARQH